MRDPARAQAWVSRILRNVLVDELRKRPAPALSVEAGEHRARGFEGAARRALRHHIRSIVFGLRVRGARMLSSSVAPGPRMKVWTRRGWARALSLCVLLFATPSTADVAVQLVSLVASVDCCDEPCEQGEESSCPEDCARCLGCAHPNALPVLAGLHLAGQVTRASSFPWHAARPYASGYRAPQFRPPAS
jgi:hypothetical protein